MRNTGRKNITYIKNALGEQRLRTSLLNTCSGVSEAEKWVDGCQKQISKFGLLFWYQIIYPLRIYLPKTVNQITYVFKFSITGKHSSKNGGRFWITAMRPRTQHIHQSDLLKHAFAWFIFVGLYHAPETKNLLQTILRHSQESDNNTERTFWKWVPVTFPDKRRTKACMKTAFRRWLHSLEFGDDRPIICDIWGYHGGEDSSRRFLGSDAV
jgi:hypothetical protein